MPRNPTTGGTKVAAVESAYAGRQQRCATPRCTNLASAWLPRLLLDVQRQA